MRSSNSISAAGNASGPSLERHEFKHEFKQEYIVSGYDSPDLRSQAMSTDVQAPAINTPLPSDLRNPPELPISYTPPNTSSSSSASSSLPPPGTVFPADMGVTGPLNSLHSGGASAAISGPEGTTNSDMSSGSSSGNIATTASGASPYHQYQSYYNSHATQNMFNSSSIFYSHIYQQQGAPFLLDRQEQYQRHDPAMLDDQRFLPNRTGNGASQNDAMSVWRPY